MKRGNWLALTVAALVTIIAWAVIVRSASSMSLSMPMPGGWSMSMAWMGMGAQSGLERAAMFLTMWTVMMIAMMVPSVMPSVLLHRRLMQSRRERGENVRGSQLLLLVGYFSVWVAFGAIAYLIGTALTGAAMRSVDISVLMPAAIGFALGIAGLYQLTSWKRICLKHCRSPLEFFSRHSLRGPGDSLLFGLHHGAYCAGCCWGLMAIQLVLGIMSLPLMALVAVLIFLEKQWRYGETLALITGIIAMVGGALLVLRAAAN
jgi:predicted metal-binding membrane protein